MSSLPRGAVARMASVTTAGRPDRLIASRARSGLASERVRLGHDEVDARPRPPTRSARRRSDAPACVTSTRWDRRCWCCRCLRPEGAGAPRDLPGDAKRRAIDPGEVFLAAHHPQLGAVGVVGEGLDHIRARVDELAVERLHQIRPIEHDLRHIGARLQISAPLELEQIPFGADHRPSGEPSSSPSGFDPGTLLVPVFRAPPVLRGLAGHHAWMASR